MFHVLIESAARSSVRSARWTAASVGTHALLIAGAVAATMRNGLAPDDKIGALPALVFVQPTVPQAQPIPAHPSAPGIFYGVPILPTIQLPTIPTIEPLGTSSLAITPTEAFGAGLVATRSGSAGLPTGGIYTDRFVDRAVIARGENGSPEYPAALRTSGLEGEVAVRFVVDSTGRVEPGSVVIVTSTHSLFDEAVRRWLTRTRYFPANVAGHRVRQLVQQRVNFNLRH
jgi:TonB family protein